MFQLRLHSILMAELLEKGKRANIGEVRDWKGQKWRKASDKKWVLVQDAHKGASFHGDAHEDVEKVHGAEGYRDTHGSKVAGLRYMISREGSTATVRVVHNASGKVLAEGYAGSYGTTGHVYDHLNHTLSKFNWKQPMDSLRSEIGANAEMRDAVKHVLDNVKNWKSVKTATQLSGAGQASKHAPKKYTAGAKMATGEKPAEKPAETPAEKPVEEPKAPVEKPEDQPAEKSAETFAVASTLEEKKAVVDKITSLDGLKLELVRFKKPASMSATRKKDGSYHIELKSEDLPDGRDEKTYSDSGSLMTAIHTLMENNSVKEVKITNGTGASVDTDLIPSLEGLSDKVIGEYVYGNGRGDSITAEDTVAHVMGRKGDKHSSAMQKKLSAALSAHGITSDVKGHKAKLKDQLTKFHEKHVVPAISKRAESRRASEKAEKQVAVNQSRKMQDMMNNHAHKVTTSDFNALQEHLQNRVNTHNASQNDKKLHVLLSLSSKELSQIADALNVRGATMGELHAIATLVQKHNYEHADNPDDSIKSMTKEWDELQSQQSRAYTPSMKMD